MSATVSGQPQEPVALYTEDVKNKQAEDLAKVVEEAVEGSGPDVDNMTPEELAAYEKQQEEEFYGSPENRKNALVLAAQIKETVGKNWFTFNRFLKKTREDKMAGDFKLQLCQKFGFIHVKMGDSGDGMENRGLKMFKVVIDKQDYVDAFNDIIAFHKEQIRLLEIQKKQYES